MLTLVVGVGNPWRGDDAAGLVVADRVRAQARGVLVETLEGDASALVHLWAGHDDVALVDAASSGAPPGTLHELRHGDGTLPAAALRSSTHAFGVADAVGLAAALGRLPARLEIYAIEGEDFSLGARSRRRSHRPSTRSPTWLAGAGMCRTTDVRRPRV